MAGTDLLPPKCQMCGRRQFSLAVGPTSLWACPQCSVSLTTGCPYPWRPYPIHSDSLRHKDWNSLWPTYFPWGLLWPHQAQADDNHGQTLQRLAERGGLDPQEMLMVIEGKPLFGAHVPKMPETMRRLRTYRIHWMRRNPKPKGGDR